MKKWITHTALVAALALATTLGSGCESTSSSSSATLITVDPPTAILVGKSSAVFTAGIDEGKDLVLPLTWTVGNPSLGGITGSGSLTAVYTSNGSEGVNTVKVVDQLGNEGVASVDQSQPVEAAPVI